MTEAVKTISGARKRNHQPESPGLLSFFEKVRKKKSFIKVLYIVLLVSLVAPLKVTLIKY